MQVIKSLSGYIFIIYSILKHCVAVFRIHQNHFILKTLEYRIL